MYNPAEDPAVVNGIQEAYGFRRGDVVEYTNPYGLTFGRTPLSDLFRSRAQPHSRRTQSTSTAIPRGTR